MSGIRTKEEQRVWCRKQMAEHDNESKEWWAANACLQGMEKIQNFSNYMRSMKEYDELKKTSDTEIARLKAKLFDLGEKYERITGHNG